jgi:predicted nuclease of predicted toxin-antitoxin system
MPLAGQIWNDWQHDLLDWCAATPATGKLSWLSQTFNVEAYALRDLQLRDAEDEQIFQKARQQGIVIISKDSDFVEMVLRLGVPPQTSVHCARIFFRKKRTAGIDNNICCE